jgi:hypothetical protein
MTYLVTADDVLAQVVAPNLPLAPNEYERRYFDQLTNTMRLYFNQRDKIIGQLKANVPLTVSNLPSAVTSGVGARAFVTDSSVSTFGTTVAGGGSTKVPVYSDGTNWKVG